MEGSVVQSIKGEEDPFEGGTKSDEGCSYHHPEERNTCQIVVDDCVEGTKPKGIL